MDDLLPAELRDYLDEAEAIAGEWRSFEGIAATHEHNPLRLATSMVLDVVMTLEFTDETFEALGDKALSYLVAAFQMGRACDNDISSSE